MQDNLVSLVIAGEGSERVTLERLIEEKALGDNVVLLGRCDNIPELLSNASYFVMTSLSEGVPGSAIEALASGTPCMLSDRITRDIDFDKRAVQYFPIDKGCIAACDAWLDIENSLVRDKKLFIQILKRNRYGVQEACDDMYNVYVDYKKVFLN